MQDRTNFTIGKNTYSLLTKRVSAAIPYLDGYIRFNKTECVRLSDLDKHIPDSFWHLFLQFAEKNVISYTVRYDDDKGETVTFVVSNENIGSITEAADFLLMNSFLETLQSDLLRGAFLFKLGDFYSISWLCKYFTTLCQMVNVHQDLLDTVAAICAQMLVKCCSDPVTYLWNYDTLYRFVHRNKRFMGTEKDIYVVVCKWLNHARQRKSNNDVLMKVAKLLLHIWPHSKRLEATIDKTAFEIIKECQVRSDTNENIETVSHSIAQQTSSICELRHSKLIEYLIEAKVKAIVDAFKIESKRNSSRPTDATNSFVFLDRGALIKFNTDRGQTDTICGIPKLPPYNFPNPELKGRYYDVFVVDGLKVVCVLRQHHNIAIVSNAIVDDTCQVDNTSWELVCSVHKPQTVCDAESFCEIVQFKNVMIIKDQLSETSLTCIHKDGPWCVNKFANIAFSQSYKSVNIDVDASSLTMCPVESGESKRSYHLDMYMAGPVSKSYMYVLKFEMDKTWNSTHIDFIDYTKAGAILCKKEEEKAITVPALEDGDYMPSLFHIPFIGLVCLGRLKLSYDEEDELICVNIQCFRYDNQRDNWHEIYLQKGVFKATTFWKETVCMQSTDHSQSVTLPMRGRLKNDHTLVLFDADRLNMWLKVMFQQRVVFVDFHRNKINTGEEDNRETYKNNRDGGISM